KNVCEKPAHRFSLIPQKVIDFGKDQDRNNHGGSVGERVSERRPQGFVIPARGEGTQKTSGIGDERQTHSLKSRNNSLSSPSFMSVVSKRAIWGGRRLR